MKVVVLSVRVPFVHGGAEELFDHLVRNLRLAGVEAEGMRLPFTWEPAERLLDEMLVARNMRLSNCDRVIVMKFPVYLVPSDNKVFWLIHQYRQAYDLRDAGQSNISDDARGKIIQSSIETADKLALSEAKKIYTVSPVITHRLKHYSGFDSIPMRVPLNDPELFVAGKSDGYILATGRVNGSKRQHLLVRGLRYAPRVRLIVAGPPDSPADAVRLRQLAEEEGVSDRLTLDLRFLSREELGDLVSRSAGVAYLPFQEDSYGYCTMEAFQARKPVITTDDSGGVLDIVRDGETGLVVPADPEALGLAMEKLSDNAALGLRLGAAGCAAMTAEKLNWPSTVEKLVS